MSDQTFLAKINYLDHILTLQAQSSECNLPGTIVRKVLFSMLNYELSTEWTIVSGELSREIQLPQPYKSGYLVKMTSHCRLLLHKSYLLVSLHVSSYISLHLDDA